MYRPGYHQVIWNGVHQANDPVASGVYLIQLISKKYTATTKVSIGAYISDYKIPLTVQLAIPAKSSLRGEKVAL